MVATGSGDDLACVLCRPSPRGGLGTVVDSPERSHARPDAKSERREVVAAFEKSDEPPGRHKAHGPRGEVRKVAGGESQIGQWIGAMRVESCGDEQPSRSELLSQRRDHIVKR
jgi:hypothetical protein